jgi:hypothetical protein
MSLIPRARSLIVILVAVYGSHVAGADESAELKAVDAAAHDSFGSSAAFDGNTAIVGAPRDDHAAGIDAGAAYVFVQQGTTWTQQAKLVALDATPHDVFGSSVAIAGDVAVVGAPHHDQGATLEAGAVYVFVRQGVTWSQQAKLVAFDAASFGRFGRSVAMAGDTLVVGAAGDAPGGIVSAGAVYAFVRNGANWSLQAKLTASDAAAHDWFGSSVSIAGDTLVTGAIGADPFGVQHDKAGAAYVFVRQGTTWSQQAKLYAFDAGPGDFFGTSVAIAGDSVVVGAPAHSHAGGTIAGAAYVFARGGVTWTQQAKLVAYDAVNFDQFGYAVAIAGDVALVSSTRGDPAIANPGSVYPFGRKRGSWFAESKLVAADPSWNHYYGTSLALVGETAIIGARGDGHAGIDAGSADVVAIEICDGSILPYGSACPGGLGAPTLELSGCASPGEAITIAMGNALGGAPALLMIGTGSGSASLNPGCSLQIFPLLPLAVSFTFAPDGTLAFAANLPPSLPAPFDLHLQTLIADPSAAFGVAATRAVQLHVE